MISKNNILIGLLIFVALLTFISLAQLNPVPQKKISAILSHVVASKNNKLCFYLNDSLGNRIGNYKTLKQLQQTQGKELIFAMNGGMFKKDHSPVGLYIEDGKIKTPIDSKQEGYGNFYLQPNGIFYLSNTGQGSICTTTDFEHNETIQYATQSGPMLIIDGNIHPKFNPKSKNTNIRNGVGVLPNGDLLFAMSKNKITFHSFASFFKEKGCKNALYLDGYVSKTYLPSKSLEEDGNFGVIIGQVK